MIIPVNKQIHRNFDFGLFDFGKEIIRYIQTPINILKEHLPQQILLVDEICKTDCTNDNLSADKGRFKKYNTKWSIINRNIFCTIESYNINTSVSYNAVFGQF